MLTYQEALDYLYSFLDTERKLPRTPVELNLPRTAALLQACGAPQRSFPSVVIAGTKGKGSTAALLEAIVRASGLRTGMWTSPHLHTYRERIQVDRRLITQPELVRAVEAIKLVVAALDQQRYGHPTVFELGFVIALRYFVEQSVDLAILEVGLGGRYDSANVVTPLVSIITSISYDHMQILGDRLAQIAYEKAGIIKPGVPVLTIPQHPEAMAEIARVAADVGTVLWIAEERPTTDHRPPTDDGEPRTKNQEPRMADQRPPTTDHRPTTDDGEPRTKNQEPRMADHRPPTDDGEPRTKNQEPRMADELKTQNSKLKTQNLVVFDPFERYHGPTKTALQGIFQRENARLATGAALLLRDSGLPIADAAIGDGLATAQWPGRLEIVAGDPPIVLDGAHNGDSAHKLILSLGQAFPGRRLVLVLGTSHDKDIQRILAELVPAADALVLTRSRHPRALVDLEELAAAAYALLPHGERTPIVLAPDMPEALDQARALAGPHNLICVTGSLFIVAAAREVLGLAPEKD